MVAVARTGEADYARSVADWDRLIADIESGRMAMEAADRIMDPWVRQGVLLLNSSFTLSRFAVAGDPHQTGGHLPLWRPIVVAVLRHLAARGTPTVFMAFGGQAADALAAAGIEEGVHGTSAAILREHPAFAEKVLALGNPFLACNYALAALGAAPIRW
jgi:uracil-DNA glycosylase